MTLDDLCIEKPAVNAKEIGHYGKLLCGMRPRFVADQHFTDFNGALLLFKDNLSKDEGPVAIQAVNETKRRKCHAVVREVHIHVDIRSMVEAPQLES